MDILCSNRARSSGAEIKSSESILATTPTKRVRTTFNVEPINDIIFGENNLLQQSAPESAVLMSPNVACYQTMMLSQPPNETARSLSTKSPTIITETVQTKPFPTRGMLTNLIYIDKYFAN